MKRIEFNLSMYREKETQITEQKDYDNPVMRRKPSNNYTNFKNGKNFRRKFSNNNRRNFHNFKNNRFKKDYSDN